MKVALLNTSDISGGAARAAYRLHTGLKNTGVDSRMLVGCKHSDDASVSGPSSKWSKGMSFVGPTLDALPLELYRKRERTMFSPAYLPDRLARRIALINADIVHLHWVCGGFIHIESLKKFRKPIAWTLHDMWAFTGGCHYAGECLKYRSECGSCPQLGSTRNNDLSRRVFRRKQKTYSYLNLHIISPSKWLATCAKKSALLSKFPIHIIPNGIDTAVFKPLHKETARNIYNLPKNKKIILFGARSATADTRKGFPLLIDTLKQLRAASDSHEDYLILIFGGGSSEENGSLYFETIYAGEFSDEISMALLYNCADVFVAPSLEDNLPNTVVESLACGTPAVAFNIGGMSDIIEHEHTGYLAQPFEPVDLAQGIIRVLANEKRREVLSRQARLKVGQEFDLKHIAQRYLDLYNDILK